MPVPAVLGVHIEKAAVTARHLVARERLQNGVGVEGSHKVLLPGAAVCVVDVLHDLLGLRV